VGSRSSVENCAGAAPLTADATYASYGGWWAANQELATLWALAAPVTTRFWSKVEATASGCWVWTGYRHEGYGKFGARRRTFYAHRFAFEEICGPVPEGLTIDHLCRNRACQHPLHMEPVTSGVNVLRGVSFAAQKARQTTCVHGHPLDLLNTHIDKRGRRRCRACSRQKYRAWYRRRRQRMTA
jgi:hypothetical protein